jgi:Arc/MetJ-type ribon-helix-helix transcriptional regulator
MELRISPQIEAEIEELMETGEFASQEDVVSKGVQLLAEYHKRQAWLHAELAIGEEQEKLGKTVVYTPELLDQIKLQAIENARLGKPIKDAIKP